MESSVAPLDSSWLLSRGINAVQITPVKQFIGQEHFNKNGQLWNSTKPLCAKGIVSYSGNKEDMSTYDTI